jgi:hypothetical protein
MNKAVPASVAVVAGYVIIFAALRLLQNPEPAAYFNTTVQVALDLAAAFYTALLYAKSMHITGGQPLPYVVISVASFLMACVNLTWGMSTNVGVLPSDGILFVLVNRLPYLAVLLLWVAFWVSFAQFRIDRLSLSLIGANLICSAAIVYLFVTFLCESSAGPAAQPVWDYIYIGLEWLALVFCISASGSAQGYPIWISAAFILLVCSDLSFNAVEITGDKQPNELGEIPWTISQIGLLLGIGVDSTRIAGGPVVNKDSPNGLIAALPVIAIAAFSGVACLLLIFRGIPQLSVLLGFISVTAMVVNIGAARYLGYSLRDDSKGGEMGKIKILLMAANPVSTSSLDLEQEIREIERELLGVKYRDRIEFVAKLAVTPDDLVRHLRREKPMILHFTGHGVSEGIVLRSESSQYHLVPGAALKQLLTDRGVAVVVLNSCFSEKQVNSLTEVVRCAVGTTSALDDGAARHFSVAFYRALGDGLSVAEALKDGKDALVVYGYMDVFKHIGEIGFRPIET